MRQKWARILGFLAVATLAVGATFLVMVLTSGTGQEADALGSMALIGMPVSIFALFFGGLAFILSRPMLSRAGTVGYVFLAVIGALFAPIGLWLLTMAYLDVTMVVFLSIGFGAYYLLWRDIRKHRKTSL